MESQLHRAAAALGGLRRLAESVGVSLQTISHWRTRGTPIERCVAIETATSGAVTRRDLRPDDWHHIWPELIDAEHPAPEEARDAA